MGGSYTNVQHSSWWARLWVEGLVKGSSGVFRVRVIVKQLGQWFRLEVHLRGFLFVFMVQCMLHDNAILLQFVEQVNRWVVNQLLTWMKKKWRNTTWYNIDECSSLDLRYSIPSLTCQEVDFILFIVRAIIHIRMWTSPKYHPITCVYNLEKLGDLGPWVSTINLSYIPLVDFLIIVVSSTSCQHYSTI